MKIVYCCPGPNAGYEKIKRIIEMLVTVDSFEVSRTLPEFEKFLRHDLTSGYPIILHASLQEHLDYFVSLQDLLTGRKVILILPDRKRNTIVLGHTLRPRFLTYNDSDFLDVASVLCRIINPQAGAAASSGRIRQLSAAGRHPMPNAPAPDQTAGVSINQTGPADGRDSDFEKY